MRLTEEQVQAAAKLGSQLYGELVKKFLVRWLDTVQIDDPQEFWAFTRMVQAVLELMAERLDAIAEVAEVAGPDHEALMLLLNGMVEPSRSTKRVGK